MHDIFEFLIQTAYASGVGIFILIIKRIFRNKLHPSWQFGVWSILATALLIPFSFSSNISFFAELLKTFTSGEYTVSRPAFFFPVPDFSVPENIPDILFLIYVSGVFVFFIKYLISFVRLKIVTKKCPPLSAENKEKLSSIAGKYLLKKCRAVTMKGLSSPFIFGFINPVLILPENFPDEKIILHELLHLKYKDAFWGIFIALFRSIHWCNPVLWHCFNKINNDIEELCDSRVLSLIEGEERREYGNILLSMANEKYSSCFGTTSIANGGKNISSRIETIVRFKQYPVNNALISVCITLIMASFLLIRVNAAILPERYIQVTNETSIAVALSAARSYFCTTPAAALDTYGKAVLQNNGIYRAVSAPLSHHEEIKNTIKQNLESKHFPLWSAGVDGSPEDSNSYYIYNFEETGDDEYSAYLVFIINYHDPNEYNNQKIAYQKVKVFKEDNRWVVTASSDFNYVLTYKMLGTLGCQDLPTYIYRAETDDFTLERHYQLCFNINKNYKNVSTPILNAPFYEVTVYTFSRCIYHGPEEKKSEITRLGFSSSEGKESSIIDKLITSSDAPSAPQKALSSLLEKISTVTDGDFSSSSTNGSLSSSTTLSENWDDILNFGGGGHTAEYKEGKMYLPAQVNGILYVNSEIYAEAVLEREN
ncbi:MAG: M56 family metallopeptidase [Clostridia bacterium]|nr:M56 family metallopeptidase [Clostridia bacterium]